MLLVSGGGELRLLGDNLHAGGTELHDGTTLTVGHPVARGTVNLGVNPPTCQSVNRLTCFTDDR